MIISSGIDDEYRSPVEAEADTCSPIVETESKADATEALEVEAEAALETETALLASEADAEVALVVEDAYRSPIVEVEAETALEVEAEEKW